MWFRSVAFSSLALWVALAAATADAEQVQALKGQSAEQTQKEIAECQATATQTSGYNPAAPPPVSSAGAPQAGGRVPGDAAGAAAGAAAAEVRGRQASYEQAVQGCLTSRGYSYTP
jgi:hypothetical protein